MKDTFKYSKIIPAHNLTALQSKIEQINRRCSSVTAIPISLTSVPARPLYEWYSGSGDSIERGWSIDPYVIGKTGAVVPCIEVTIEGQIPQWNGWQFVGVASPMGDKNLLLTMRDDLDLTKCENRIGECDHCQTKRYRKNTFIIHKEGDIKMVGSSCIGEYVGLDDPMSTIDGLTGIMNLRQELESEESFHAHQAPIEYDILFILNITAAVIRKDGWMSKTKAGIYDIPTSTTVSEFLFARTGSAATEMRERYEQTPKDKQRAQRTLSWLKNLKAPSEESNYLYNLSVIGKAGFVSPKGFGLLCSAIASYEREEMEKTEKAAKEYNVEELGEVGTRLDLELTCLKRFEKASAYSAWSSMTFVHIFSDTENRRILWFCSNEKNCFEIGETAKAKASIKKYSHLYGLHCTTVNRVSRTKSVNKSTPTACKV